MKTQLTTFQNRLWISKRFRQLATSFLLLSTFWIATPGNAQELLTRNVSQYNLSNSGVGLKGYDPVSYFPEGGGQPLVGTESFKLSEGGVTYFFANSKNQTLFMQNPSKFEPTYGGWCAYAMSQGSKVDIDPSIYMLHGNRLHFFVSHRAKQNFDLDVMGREKLADGFWKQFSGEDPRN